MDERCLSEKAVYDDIASVRFQVGVARKQWRIEYCEFPILIMAVTAIEPEGNNSEYNFRFELAGFKATPPMVQIWNIESGDVLAEAKRPKGSQRVIEAFKKWGNNTVYRPWERDGVGHNHWLTKHPELAWHPKRDLAFILEDLHGLLTSNAVKSV